VIQRILAAVVGLSVVVPVIIWGGVHGVVVVATLALLVGLDEWARMAAPGANRSALVALVAGGLPVFGAMAYGTGEHVLLALALGCLLVLLATLFGVKRTEDAANHATRLVAGLVYLPLLLGFVVWIRRFDDGVAWIFLLLAATWMGDTGAYFAGRAFGKHKLFERISPKKTWEGAIGGLVFSVACGGLVKFLALPDVPWVHALVVAALIDISGVLGDLVESMFKRSFGVKDSGRIMPGHGGILDRIDSLLFSAPVAWAYWTLLG